MVPGLLLKPGPSVDPSKKQMKGAHGGTGTADSGRDDTWELVSRSKKGDTGAFGVLVGRYRDRSYGLALRLTRSAPDAEEVAQDAFLSAWRSLDSFRGDAAFGSWLYRIVWRKALDRADSLRTRGRREVAVDDPARVEGEGTAAVGVEMTATPGRDFVVSERLERLLAALPETARAVVTLFYYEDQSVAAVAAALGIPEGTVKTHLHRARAALRAGWLLETEGKDDHALR